MKKPTKPTPRLLHTFTAFLILGLGTGLPGGCSSGEEPTKATAPRMSPTSVRNKPRPRPTLKVKRTPLRASIRREMKKVMKGAREMHRRAKGNISVVGPAKMIAKSLVKVPARKFPPNFESFMDDLNDRLEIISGSKDIRHDFNGLISSCLACHRVYNQKPLPHIMKLRLPATSPNSPGGASPQGQGAKQPRGKVITSPTGDKITTDLP